LEVQITAGNKFCCLLRNAKRSFYRGFNCIFGKVGRIASEKCYLIELLQAKCLPGLWTGGMPTRLNESHIRSLEYILNNAFRKIFLLNSCDLAYECVVLFNCSVSDAMYRRKVKFLTKLLHSGIIVCTLFTDIINRELSSVGPNVTYRHCIYR